MADQETQKEKDSSVPKRDTLDQPVLVSPHEYRKMSRRNLLQLAPLALSSALFLPRVQKEFLREGLALSDWVSGKFFSRLRRAQTFSESEVVSFERFPYNYSSVLDPGIDLEKWTLTVEGLVRRPGNYTLPQIQALPKITQNTRHICIEGWDAIGNQDRHRPLPRKARFSAKWLNTLNCSTLADFSVPILIAA